MTGDDFSHTQTQNGQATNGEYRVKLPDGRVQIVSYIADKNGYKADVKYTENDVSSPNIQIQRGVVPSKSPIPILKPNSYDYQYADIGESPRFPTTTTGVYDSVPVLYAPTPTRSTTISPDYESYIAVTPKPTLYSALNFYTHTSRPHNVEIYTNGNPSGNRQLSNLLNYVTSTVAPFVLVQQDTEGYENGVVSSAIVPNVNKYTPGSYVRSPKFRIVQNKQHSLVYGK